MSQVVVVGSFNVDHVWRCRTLPQPGATLAGEYASGPGGKGFNQAVAAARAGARTGFVCALGDDAGGQLARALAANDGIDLRELRSDAPTGTAGIFVDAQGHNSILIGAGANAALSAAFVAAHSAAITAASVLLAQLESPADAVMSALRVARDAAVVTLLNPAPADAVATAEMLALVDILTPNESEFCAQLARHGGASPDPATLATRGDAELHALCRRLLPHGSVVITLGAGGCFVSHRDDDRHGDDGACYRVAGETVDTLDTTGAGDAFNGALAASLATRPDAAFLDHVRFANRYASLSTENTGAANAMPHLAEVNARFTAL